MTDPLIGKTYGDYKITALLGHGGMARVYRGLDEKLQRYAAIKIIDADPQIGDLEEYQQRFTREARAIAHLDHPNIVGIYQFGQQGNVYFMAMHFVEGRDLRYVLQQYHQQEARMPDAEVMNIARDIASALDYAHRQGVIHRDVKPSNIMVTPDGRAILTDFGLALSQSERTPDNTFGSAHYIAPEQAVSSANAVPPSDLYSLGVVLYEMLSGQVPFDDPSAMAVALKHLELPPPSPRQFNPNVPFPVERVLLRMLAKQPEDRFPNGAEMVNALETALRSQDVQEDTIRLSHAAAGPPAPDAPFASEDMAFVLLPELDVRLSGAQTARQREAPDPVVLPDIAQSPQTWSSAGRKRRPWLWIGVAAIAVIALALGVVLLSGGGGAPIAPSATPGVGAGAMAASPTISLTDEPTATTVPTEMASPTALQPTATEAAVVAVAPTATATDIPTVTAVPAATTEAPTATNTPPSPTATATPTATPAPRGDILLVYDEEAMLLVNQSDRTLNVQALTFRRDNPAGRPIFFAAADWTGGFAPPSALPPQECFQVWRYDLNVIAQDMPFDTALCARRAAWRAVSPSRWFWIHDSPGATFTVIQSGEIIATCDIPATRCAFSLP